MAVTHRAVADDDKTSGMAAPLHGMVQTVGVARPASRVNRPGPLIPLRHSDSPNVIRERGIRTKKANEK
jgi:hypothetical protein